MFPTSTKENPDAIVSAADIREIKSRISKPLVAIGGITLESARSVIDAGADSVAVISDLLATTDITERTRRFLESLA